MKHRLIFLSLFIALVVIIMPITATAATTAPSESKITVSVSPTQSHSQAPETPVKVTITPSQTSRRPPGEVEVPIAAVEDLAGREALLVAVHPAWPSRLGDGFHDRSPRPARDCG